MNTANQKEPDNEELPHSDSSLSQIGLAWQQVLNAYKVQWKKAEALVVADFQLSFKALILSILCVLMLIGFALITWSVVLVVTGYALHLFNVHWLVIALAILSLNIVIMLLIKKLYVQSVRTINMQTTRDMIFNKNSGE